MTDRDERVTQQIDAITERADRAAEDARWGGPDVYKCQRCGHWFEDEAHYGTCGNHRDEP